MKGYAENTIPQRQFENIKVHYEFSNEEEKEEALEALIKDCIKYKNIVHLRENERDDAIQIPASGSTPMDAKDVAKFYKLPAGTTLQKVYNKELKEYLYFDVTNGKHYNHPKV